MIFSATCFDPYVVIIMLISKTYLGSLHVTLWKRDLTSYKLFYPVSVHSVQAYLIKTNVKCSSGLKFMEIFIKS